MVRVFYIFNLLVRGLGRRPWGSLISLVACWFAVCQLVLVFHAVSFTNQAKTLRGTTGTMIAYVAGRQEDGAIQGLRKQIAAMEEVAYIEFIPCSTGLDRLRQWLGPDDSLVSDLDPAVLPDAFEIRLKPEHTGSIENVAQRLGKIPEVEDVRYDRGILGFIADAYYPVLFSGVIVAVVVVLSLSLVVFLSIRVGMISRRQEMEVLHLLGAGRVFLYSPYIMEALIYGVGGAVMAIITVEGALALITSRAPVLEGLVSPMGIPGIVVAVFLPGFLSLLGAHLAIKRSIDE